MRTFSIDNDKYFRELCDNTKEKLDPNKFTVIRIDGHKFSKYTRGFLKPYDPILHYILDSAYHITFNKILNKQFDCWYSQSDEVTVVIAPIKHVTQTMPFGIKSKLTSILPSAISTMVLIGLQYVLNQAKINPYDNIFEQLIDVMFEHGAIFKDDYDFGSLIDKTYQPIEFDARVFQTDDFEDIIKVLTWRRVDGINNSKNMYAQYFLGKKPISGMKNVERIEKMKNECGFEWYELPTCVKRGMFFNNSSKYKYDFNKDDVLTETYKNMIINNTFK